MRPDLVVNDNSLGNDLNLFSIDIFGILDWKYVDQNSFINTNKKIKTDVTKQLSYEFSVQKSNSNAVIQSDFYIPWFGNRHQMDNEILNPLIRNNGLRVFKANFSKIQEIYLTHD